MPSYYLGGLGPGGVDFTKARLLPLSHLACSFGGVTTHFVYGLEEESNWTLEPITQPVPGGQKTVAFRLTATAVLPWNIYDDVLSDFLRDFAKGPWNDFQIHCKHHESSGVAPYGYLIIDTKIGASEPTIWSAACSWRIESVADRPRTVVTITAVMSVDAVDSDLFSFTGT